MSKMDMTKVIEHIFEHYEGFLKEENGSLLLIDPNDRKIIGFHYGESHLGAAMIIYGCSTGNQKWIDTGIEIVDGFLLYAKEYQKEPAYHWDFNNFAFCILVNYLEHKMKNVAPAKIGVRKEFINKVREFTICQKDSNNATINWHPMRAYVNFCKAIWLSDDKYRIIAEKLLNKVCEAQYEDGFYEDLLPKGKSFNFQYHIYTAAVMYLIKSQGLADCKIDKALEQVLNIVDPNGDINYLGRGINQIFAWGPALYLFYITKSDEYLKRTWKYFVDRIFIAIDNNNIILNDQPGEEKGWWWDYHYASVYFAHLAFWLVLSEIMIPYEKGITRYQGNKSDSGVQIYRTNNYQVCIFNGRKHYLAEKGPQIANICSNRGQYIFKGSLGPFCGSEYGTKYAIPSNTIHDFFGVVQEKMIFGYLAEKIIFPDDIQVKEENEKLYIQFEYHKEVSSARINLPLLCPKECVLVKVDDVQIPLQNAGKVMGAYGQTNLYISPVFAAKKIKIIINRMD